MDQLQNCTGILRQQSWLRVASAIVLTAGQNQRYVYRCHAGAWNCRAIEPDASDPIYGSPKKKPPEWMVSFFGDPYGNRTHITAVKGRCLNLLTNGPGSGNLTRTDDTPGMNRMLYQLSYAAIAVACRISRARCIIRDSGDFVNRILKNFQKNFCIVSPARTY